MINLDKEKIIADEIKELTRITKNIAKDKRTYADRLIEQASFMYATLRELQITLNEDGAVELFRNGAQEMLREHPATKIYNTMIKNYSSVIKQLSDMTPRIEAEKDPLQKFLEKAKKK